VRRWRAGSWNNARKTEVETGQTQGGYGRRREIRSELGLTLRATGSYSLFLMICGIAGLVGGGFFMLLKRQPVAQTPVAATAQERHYNAEPGTCAIKHTS
jgi:hypothetical protein